ncbi:MAG: Lrp/AsnC ligand binding domain-containing protein [Proteobacteria bacterium]|nr:Lrp/AsnC ligand binding domain-containing protein [Pseudomonadota bacterium]
MSDTLDRADLKILRALQQDGRLSTVALAEKVGLSPTATTERVKRLTRDGFIKGYHAELNPALLDRSLLVFIEVTLDKTTPDVFAKFAVAVRASREILECHLVAGGFDYLIKTRVKDMEAYRYLLTQTILSMPGVRESRSYAVMEEVKHQNELPV